MTRRSPLLLLAVFLLTSCGPSERNRALTTSLAALNAARDSFLAYDAAHQADLVRAAPSEEAGKLTLIEYRARRLGVLEAFVAAYSLLSVAAADPTDAKILASEQALTILMKLLGEFTGSASQPSTQPSSAPVGDAEDVDQTIIICAAAGAAG